jgi:hypothetical protein
VYSVEGHKQVGTVQVLQKRQVYRDAPPLDLLYEVVGIEQHVLRKYKGKLEQFKSGALRQAVEGLRPQDRLGAVR